MRTPNGFTLIEILLNITISAVTLLGVSAFLTMMLQTRVKNQTISEVNQQGAVIMHTITQAVRNSESIVVPAAGASGSSLVVTVDDPSLSPTVFSVSGGVLYITEGAGSAVALSNALVEVSNLTVQNLSLADTPGTVRVQFTIARDSDSVRNEYDFTQTFYGSATSRQP